LHNVDPFSYVYFMICIIPTTYKFLYSTVATYYPRGSLQLFLTTRCSGPSKLPNIKLVHLMDVTSFTSNGAADIFNGCGSGYTAS